MKEYLIVDTNKKVDEKYLRELLFEYETKDLLSNQRDYLSGSLDLEYQFKCIKKSVDGNIEEVIEILNSSWQVPVVKNKPYLNYEQLDNLADETENKKTTWDNFLKKVIIEEILSGIESGNDIRVDEKDIQDIVDKMFNDDSVWTEFDYALNKYISKYNLGVE